MRRRTSRLVRTTAAVAVALTTQAGLGASLLASPASAATGGVSSVALSVIADGTAPFSSAGASGPGVDLSAADGVVRTGDTVTFGWSFTTTTPGDVTFEQTLSAGSAFDPASLAGCEPATSSISADGTVLTCTLPGLIAGLAGFQTTARIGAVADGSTVTSTLLAPGAAGSNASVRATAAAPQVQTSVAGMGAGASIKDGVQGFVVNQAITLWQAIDPVQGVRGRESLAESFSFVVDLSTWGPNATIEFCEAQGLLPTDGLPYGRLSTSGATPANSVRESGTWTCDQPGGPGTPVTVTVTGADTTALTYPFASRGGAPVDPARALMAMGRFDVWTPVADYPGATTLSAKILDFDPLSLSGQSNFGSGTAPGQEPGAVCTPGVNCLMGSFDPTATSFQADAAIAGPTALAGMGSPRLDGQSSAWAGDAPLLPGQPFSYQMRVINMSPIGAPAQDITYCAAFDPTLVEIDSSRDLKVVSAWGHVWPASSYTVEYGTTAHADDAARRDTLCGTAGDGAPGWYPSVAAAGGPDAVSSVRVLLDHELAAVGAPAEMPYVTGAAIVVAPLVRTTDEVTPGTDIPVFSQMSSDGAAPWRSTFHPDTQSGSRGDKAIATTTLVRAAVSWDNATSASGATRTVTVSPSATSEFASTPQPARDTTVQVVLPSADLAYVDHSASVAPRSITPTADGLGTILTFALGDLVTGEAIAPITFRVNVLPTATMPRTIPAQALVASPDDASRLSVRQTEAPLAINSPATFSLSLLASSTLAQPGDPFDYTIGWTNRLTSSVGVATIVDVLPYDGDSNGTTGLGSLSVDAVTTTDASDVEYTTDAPADVVAALDADGTGSTGIAWTTTRPASGTTAVRITTSELLSGAAGSATVTVTPSGLTDGATITGSLTAASLSSQPTVQRGVSPVTVTGAASLVKGRVYQDEDFSGAHTPGDAPLAGVKLTLTGYSYGPDGLDGGGPGTVGADDAEIAPLTTMSTADGTYTFESVHAGSYAVAVTAGVPAGLQAAQVPSGPITAALSTDVADLDFGFARAVDAPALLDDTATTHAEEPVTVAVLANDTVDATTTIQSVGTPLHGSAAVAAGGLEVVYTPEPGFLGTDSVTYTTTDVLGQEATATLSITVVGWPVAQDDTARTAESTPVLIDVLANDSGTGLTVTDVSDVPADASALVIDGKIEFTPAPGSGVQQLRYTVTDALGATSSAQAAVTVRARPTAEDFTVRTGAGHPVDASVLDHATGSGLTITDVTSPAAGSTTVDGALVRYTPAGNGSDSFVVTVTDEVGQQAQLTVTVEIVDGTVVNDDRARTATEMPVDVDVLANDQGEDITVISVTAPLFGTATVAADGQTVSYSPASSFSGVDGFSYTIVDSVGVEAQGTVTVTVLAPPALSDVSATTPRDTSVQLDVTTAYNAGTATSRSGQPLRGAVTAVTAGTPAHGTAVLDGDMHIAYTPAPGFVGTDTFEYVVTDELGQTGTATATITVTALPVPTPDEPGVTPTPGANGTTATPGTTDDPAKGGLLASTGAALGAATLLAGLLTAVGIILVKRRRQAE